MLITEDNAVFISSLLDPHAEHLVNLLMKSQLPRSITRGVGLLELFPWSFWGEEQIGTVLILRLFSFLVFFWRNSSEISLSGWRLVIFRAEQSKKHPVGGLSFSSTFSSFDYFFLAGNFQITFSKLSLVLVSSAENIVFLF